MKGYLKNMKEQLKDVKKERKKELKFLTKYYEDKKKHDDEIFLYSTYPRLKDKYYVISNYGQVIRFITNKNMKSHKDKDGYLRLSLSAVDEDSGKRIAIYIGIHRLVAWEYCKKPTGCDIVNHLDCNNQNNHAENLEWTTVKGNTQHAIEHGLTVRAGCNSNGAKYDQEIVEDICGKLEFGMDVHQVYETYYPYAKASDHHNFYMLIYRLKYNDKYLYPIRNKYNISTEKYSSLKKQWTKDDILELENLIKSGKTNKEILNYYGFSKSKDPGAQRIDDKTCEIRKRLGIDNPDRVYMKNLKAKITGYIKDGKPDEEIYRLLGIKYKYGEIESNRAHKVIYKIRQKLQIPDPSQ